MSRTQQNLLTAGAAIVTERRREYWKELLCEGPPASVSGAIAEFLEQQASAVAGRPLHVLQLGRDACQVALTASPWARSCGMDVRFTCLNLRPPGRLTGTKLESFARACCDSFRCPDAAVELLREEISTHRPGELYDCAIASGVLEDLGQADFVLLLHRLRSLVRGGVLIEEGHSSAARQIERLLGSVRGATFSIERRLAGIQAIVQF